MCAASWGFPSSHTPRAEAITFEATPVVHHSKFRRPMSAVGHARRTDTLRRSRHVRFTPESGHRKTWLVMSALCQKRTRAPQRKSYHSTISSARVSSVAGSSRPSASAVLRLMNSSIFVDCWTGKGPVVELVGIEGGVVSGVFNLESSGVEAPDRRPRHEEHYHEA